MVIITVVDGQGAETHMSLWRSGVMPEVMSPGIQFSMRVHDAGPVEKGFCSATWNTIHALVQPFINSAQATWFVCSEPLRVWRDIRFIFWDHPEEACVHVGHNVSTWRKSRLESFRQMRHYLRHYDELRRDLAAVYRGYLGPNVPEQLRAQRKFEVLETAAMMFSGRFFTSSSLSTRMVERDVVKFSEIVEDVSVLTAEQAETLYPIRSQRAALDAFELACEQITVERPDLIDAPQLRRKLIDQKFEELQQVKISGTNKATRRAEAARMVDREFPKLRTAALERGNLIHKRTTDLLMQDPTVSFQAKRLRFLKRQDLYDNAHQGSKNARGRTDPDLMDKTIMLPQDTFNELKSRMKRDGDYVDLLAHPMQNNKKQLMAAIANLPAGHNYVVFSEGSPPVVYTINGSALERHLVLNLDLVPRDGGVSVVHLETLYVTTLASTVHEQFEVNVYDATTGDLHWSQVGTHALANVPLDQFDILEVALDPRGALITISTMDNNITDSTVNSVQKFLQTPAFIMPVAAMSPWGPSPQSSSAAAFPTDDRDGGTTLDPFVLWGFSDALTDMQAVPSIEADIYAWDDPWSQRKPGDDGDDFNNGASGAGSGLGLPGCDGVTYDPSGQTDYGERTLEDYYRNYVRTNDHQAAPWTVDRLGTFKVTYRHYGVKHRTRAKVEFTDSNGVVHQVDGSPHHDPYNSLREAFQKLKNIGAIPEDYYMLRTPDGHIYVLEVPDSHKYFMDDSRVYICRKTAHGIFLASCPVIRCSDTKLTRSQRKQLTSYLNNNKAVKEVDIIGNDVYCYDANGELLASFSLDDIPADADDIVSAAASDPTTLARHGAMDLALGNFFSFAMDLWACLREILVQCGCFNDVVHQMDIVSDQLKAYAPARLLDARYENAFSLKEEGDSAQFQYDLLGENCQVTATRHGKHVTLKVEINGVEWKSCSVFLNSIAHLDIFPLQIVFNEVVAYLVDYLDTLEAGELTEETRHTIKLIRMFLNFIGVPLIA